MSGINRGDTLSEDSEEFQKIHFQLTLSTIHLGIISSLTVVKFDNLSLQEQYEGYNNDVFPRISCFYPTEDFLHANTDALIDHGFKPENSKTPGGYFFDSGSLRFEQGADPYQQHGHSYFFVEVAAGRSYLRTTNAEDEIKVPSGFNSLKIIDESMSFIQDGQLDLEAFTRIANFSNRQASQYHHRYFISDMQQICPKYLVHFTLQDRLDYSQKYYEQVEQRIFSELSSSRSRDHEENSSSSPSPATIQPSASSQSLEDIAIAVNHNNKKDKEVSNIDEIEELENNFYNLPQNFLNSQEIFSLIQENKILLQEKIQQMSLQYSELFNSIQMNHNSNEINKKLHLLQLIIHEKLKLFLSIEIELNREIELIKFIPLVLQEEFQRFSYYLQQSRSFSSPSPILFTYNHGNGNGNEMIILKLKSCFLHEFQKKIWLPYQLSVEHLFNEFIEGQNKILQQIELISPDLKVTADVKPLIKSIKKGNSNSSSSSSSTGSNKLSSSSSQSTGHHQSQSHVNEQNQDPQLQQEKEKEKENSMILESIQQYHTEKLSEIQVLMQEKLQHFQQISSERNFLKEWKQYKNHFDFQDSNFQVLMSCEDNLQRKWCLIQRSEFQNHQNIIEEWVLESILQLSYENEIKKKKSQKSSTSTSSSSSAVNRSKQRSDQFSIEGDEDDDEDRDESFEKALHIPMTIQHSLHQQFDREKQELQREKQELEKEIENSRTAFERYRERARDSLLKTANDQKSNEQKIEKLKEQIKTDQKAQEQFHQQIQQLKQNYHHSLQEYQSSITKEKVKVTDLLQKLDRIQEEVENREKIMNQREDELRKQRELEDKAEIEKEFQLKCENFQIRIKELEGKESQLISEMKKKSDTARQLLISKDKEIDQLKTKLSSLLNANKDSKDNNNGNTQSDNKEVGKESVPVPPPISTPQKDSQQHQAEGGYHKSSSGSSLNAHNSSEQLFSVPSTPNQQQQQQPAHQQQASSLEVDDILSLEEKRVISELTKAQMQLQTQPTSSSSSSAGGGPPLTAQQQKVILAFNEEFYKRAISRENELLEQMKVLKNEVNSLRGRVSIMNHSLGSASTASIHHHNSGSNHNLQQQGMTPRAAVGSPSKAPHQQPPLPSSLMKSTDELEAHRFAGAMEGGEVVLSSEEEYEREQRLLYLKQAFVGFFKAKQAVEMQHLGRVICAILGVSVEEQEQIMEHIVKLTPAVVATSTFESFSQSFASIFS